MSRAALQTHRPWVGEKGLTPRSNEPAGKQLLSRWSVGGGGPANAGVRFLLQRKMSVSGKYPTPSELGLHLAWRFTEVLPGEFARDRAETRDKTFPLVGPLPNRGKETIPLEGEGLVGPYLYVVFDRGGEIKYVGKATEVGLVSPLERWIRPNREKTKWYWAHGTNKKTKATVTWIAEVLNGGNGPLSLYFSNYRHFVDRIRVRSEIVGAPFFALESLAPEDFIKEVEHALTYWTRPLDQGRAS